MIHEYHLMEEFIETLKSERADRMEYAIQGLAVVEFVQG